MTQGPRPEAAGFALSRAENNGTGTSGREATRPCQMAVGTVPPDKDRLSSAPRVRGFLVRIIRAQI
jgi:hypothetical protein